MAFLPMMGVLTRALFHKHVTLKAGKTFPETRGHIDNDIPRCIFCGICQKRCPTGAIEVGRAERTWAIAQYDCMQCSCCVEVCPKKCLTMSHEPPKAVDKQTWITMRGAPAETENA